MLGNRSMLGKHHTKKSKKQISRTMKRLIKEGKIQPYFKKGYKMSKVARQNLSKSLMGRVSPMKGKKLTKEVKDKISRANKGMHPTSGFKKGHKHSKITKGKIGKSNSLVLKGRKLSEKHKENIRKSLIHYVEKVRLNGKVLYPCIGKYEKQILNNLEYCFGYPIKRQHRVAGYFIDGYCPMLNLAIEVDELYKHKRKIQKDIERENTIKNNLHCNFIRIPVGGWLKP